MSRSARQTLPKLMPRRRQKLTAVVPAFNEAENLASLIEELKAFALPGQDFDYVVVDDGSRDNSLEIARLAGAPVVSLPFNMGIGISVQTGFQYALSQGADFVVQVDGDGQHIPGEIEKLMASLLEGKADVIIGTRFARGRAVGLESTTVLRWLASRMLTHTIRLLTGKRLSDTTSGFRLFNRKAAGFVAANYPDDYPEVQVLVMLARAGFRIKEVPVKMRSRKNGTSSINWWRSIYYIGKVLFASFMDKVR